MGNTGSILDDFPSWSILDAVNGLEFEDGFTLI